MGSDEKSVWMKLRTSVRKLVFGGPWRVLVFIFRLVYRFRIDSRENLPEDGPFILGISEHSLISTVLSGWISVVMLEKAMDELPAEDMVSYLHEELIPFLVLPEGAARRERGGTLQPTHSSLGRAAVAEPARRIPRAAEKRGRRYQPRG